MEACMIYSDTIHIIDQTYTIRPPVPSFWVGADNNTCVCNSFSWLKYIIFFTCYPLGNTFFPFDIPDSFLST